MKKGVVQERLQNAIAGFVVRWVTINTPPENREIAVRVSVTFSPLTETEGVTELKRQRIKRSAEKRPLTSEEWYALKRMPFPPQWQRILDFFLKRGNNEASTDEMVAAGIIPDHSYKFASFNNFCKRHGSNCVIKRSRTSNTPGKSSTFRIFPLVWKSR